MPKKELKATSPYQQKKARDLLTRRLQEMPENWVNCRDMRHAWAVENDFHVVEQKQEKGGRRTMHVGRDLICMRCPTIRHEVYIVTRYDGLEKVSQSYSYPEGYQIPGVPRGVKPQSIIQQEQYRRAMEKVAHAARGEREHAER